MEEGLLKNTGKTLEEWKKIVLNSGLEKHGQIVKLLKEEHGMTHGYANFVTLKARQTDAGSIDDKELVKSQYEGKEGLIPVYDELIKVMNKLGGDVKFTPKKDSVSCIRNRQFALIKPATKTRIDLGLKIKGKEPQGRLENSGPFGTMVSHRVRLEKPSDVDGELRKWIEEAYELN